MPVSRIEDHMMSNDGPGPISLALKEFYWAQHEAGWHMTPLDYENFDQPFVVGR
jgi:branched-chain amino acid aminotransferase